MTFVTRSDSAEGRSRRQRVAVAALGIGMVLATGTSGASNASSTPAPQSAHLMVYDERIRKVVLVSGHDGGVRPALADVWTFDGISWARLAGHGLPSRFLAAGTYDSRRRQLVVFGGRTGRAGMPASDVWEWDGLTWRERSDTSIGVREHHAIAFDAARLRTVMYGGTATPGNGPDGKPVRTWPEDVAEWDGVRWTQVHASGPGARNGPALAYDALRRVVVMFGGVGRDGTYPAGTWQWDGRAWKRTSANDPPLRATHQMAYDHRLGVVVLYGGGFVDGGLPVRRGDMWQWDGTRWTEVVMRGATPGPRIGHGMAYDRSRERLVLFGGFDGNSQRRGDTWEWDGTRWTDVTPR
jgi:hypothetical protein